MTTGDVFERSTPQFILRTGSFAPQIHLEIMERSVQDFYQAYWSDGWRQGNYYVSNHTDTVHLNIRSAYGRVVFAYMSLVLAVSVDMLSLVLNCIDTNLQKSCAPSTGLHYYLTGGDILHYIVNN